MPGSHKAIIWLITYALLCIATIALTFLIDRPGPERNAADLLSLFGALACLCFASILAYRTGRTRTLLSITIVTSGVLVLFAVLVLTLR